ncbi:MAG: aldo/keto reductase [Proteobacteria bacterium]|nr:aldo/keto reductase [Pseudomonadota bacterium]MCP4919013.1 aldo/keto reductase [Pseudomonadota bacterium]
MQAHLLPGTEIELSVLTLGCWALGGEHWGEPVSERDRIATVRCALDLGITVFDTSPIYGDADRVLVEALGDARHDVVLATKVGVDRGHSNLNPAFLRQDLEATLRRLRVDRVDLMQVHWPCEHGTPLESTFEALEQLRDEGKVRAVGVCNYGAAELLRIRAIAQVVSLQTPYSLVRREFEQGLRAASKGMGVLAYEPLCRGLLAGAYSPGHRFPDNDLRSRDERFRRPRFRRGAALARDLARVGEKVGLPAAAVAIGWVAAQPGITTVIAGAKHPEQVRQNALAVKLLDSAKVWQVVGRIAAVHEGG